MTLEGHRREILVLARTGYVVLRIEPAPLACLAPLRVATGLPAPFRRSPGWLPSPLGWRPSMALQTRQKRRRSRVRDTAAAGVVDTSRKTWPSLTDEGRTLTLEGLLVRVLTRRATARSPTHSNSRRASLRGAAAPHPAIHMTAHPFRNVF
uniref:Uncharacterized protein n=6 Tax=Gammaproteobacteria TaxID=1236 RepID=A0A218MAZ0_PSEAI|nr:Hypothetical protein [Pseudomonas aeruginosa]